MSHTTGKDSWLARMVLEKTEEERLTWKAQGINLLAGSESSIDKCVLREIFNNWTKLTSGNHEKNSR